MSCNPAADGHVHEYVDQGRHHPKHETLNPKPYEYVDQGSMWIRGDITLNTKP
jgi:hypothetical protein